MMMLYFVTGGYRDFPLAIGALGCHHSSLVPPWVPQLANKPCFPALLLYGEPSSACFIKNKRAYYFSPLTNR